MRSKLSFRALTTLFDSLIKPIILYGSPIWTPCCTTTKSLIKSITRPNRGNSNILKKIGQSLQEKVHLSFLKWSLGVHRKASNVGVWGESGRFPLIFEAVRLSLNYYKRLNSMKGNSFVASALREQKALNLPWYKNVKCLLENDDIYSLDHVSAHRALKSQPIKEKSPNHQFQSSFNHLRELKPVQSKKFRVWKIMEILKDHFTHCWEDSKSSSPKLQFYHSVKSVFSIEPYLQLCKGFSRRASTTKLRISAHELQIERGRYINIPREQRICTWCKTNIDIECIEDEEHALYDCDLYSRERLRLISNLNNIPFTYQDQTENINSHQFDLNISNLKNYLPYILSPNILLNEDLNDVWNESLHKSSALNIDPQSPSYACFQKRRSYAITNICTFILKCFDDRRKLTENTRRSTSETRARNNIIVNILSN